MAAQRAARLGVVIRRPVTSGRGGNHVGLFVACVALLGVICIGTAFMFWGDEDFGRWWIAVLFLGLITLDQAVDLKFVYRLSGIKKDTMELFLMAYAVVAPPFAVFISVLAAAELGLLIRRKQPVKHLFNLGMFSVCTFVFLALFGALQWYGLSRLLAVIIAATVYYFLNALIVSMVVSYTDGVSVRTILIHEGGIQLMVVVGNVSLGALCTVAALSHPGYVVFVLPALLILHVGYADRMRAMTNNERLTLLMEATQRAHRPEIASEVQRELVEVTKQLMRCDTAEFLEQPREAGALEAIVPITLHEGTKWLLIGRTVGGKFSDYDLELLGSIAVVATSAFGSLEARQLRQQVELNKEADRVRGDMIASLSHELRTPLTSIIGFGELLLARPAEPAQSKQFLEMIHSQAVRLRSIVETLLDYQALRGKGTRELTVQQVNLADHLRDAVASFSVSLAVSDIRLECPDDLTVIADPVRVHQVIENLLSNAVKYSPEGGPIIVRGFRREGNVRVEVEDHGVGIPESAREGMFTRFYRVRNERTEHVTGTGLGLAFCREVIDAHGGAIDYRSVEEQGSCFWFELTEPAGSKE